MIYKHRITIALVVIVVIPSILLDLWAHQTTKNQPNRISLIQQLDKQSATMTEGAIK